MIAPADLLLYAGGACLERYGRLWRVTRPADRAGEEAAPTYARAGSCSVVDRDGAIRFAGANVPRVTWRDLDGDGVREPCLLVEATEDNKWTRSQELDHADWPRSALVSVTANAATAPDGTTTAEKLIEDGTSAVHGLTRTTPALSDNRQQSASIYAKADTRSWLYIRTTDKAGTTRHTWFNLGTGVVGTTDAGHVVLLEAHGSGWYRCGVVFDSASGATASEVVFAMATGDNVATYAGDGASGLYVWGAQYEQNRPYPTSYIPTTTAAVTRASDALYWPAYFPPQTLTVYARFLDPGGAANAQANATALAIGGDPALEVRASGGVWTAYHYNGVSSVSSAAGSASAVADLVELRITLSATGVIQLHQSLDGAAEVAGAASAALALATSWSTPRCQVGGNTTPTNYSSLLHHAVMVARGAPSVADFRAWLP